MQAVRGILEEKKQGWGGSIRNAHSLFLEQHIKKLDLSRIQKPCQISRAIKQGTSYIPGKLIAVIRDFILFGQQRPLEEQAMST